MFLRPSKRAANGNGNPETIENEIQAHRATLTANRRSHTHPCLFPTDIKASVIEFTTSWRVTASHLLCLASATSRPACACVPCTASKRIQLRERAWHPVGGWRGRGWCNEEDKLASRWAYVNNPLKTRPPRHCSTCTPASAGSETSTASSPSSRSLTQW